MHIYVPENADRKERNGLLKAKKEEAMRKEKHGSGSVSLSDEKPK